MAATVYRHSGQMGRGPIFLPVAAIGVTLALAFVYGYVCVYNPLAGIVSFLIPLGYGALIGAALMGTAKAAHCRSEGTMQITAALTFAIALYAAWASFLSVLVRRELADAPGMLGMMANPGAMWEVTKVISENGWFTVHDATPSGIILWVFWLGEAAIIGGTMYGVTTMLSDSVYCENCHQWCKEKKGIETFAAPPLGDVVTRIKDGDLVALAELRKPEPGRSLPILRLDTQRCEKCSETATFQVVQVTQTMKDGKKSESVEKWTRHVLLNTASLAAFEEALKRRALSGITAPVPAVASSTPQTLSLDGDGPVAPPAVPPSSGTQGSTT